MQVIASEAELQQWLQRPAVLVLWGSADCGVCQAIKPRIAELAVRQFAGVALAYVDCACLPAACAQQGVFTLPVLRLYVQGKMVLEYARAFGLQQVQADVLRVLSLLE